jgi:ectoine hydroxylase-related dioxygenase (phytanoyl-CoA dioxygenase family)
VTKFTDEHKRVFEQDGCCIIENVLTQKEVTDIKLRVTELARIEEEAGTAHFYAEGKSAQRVWNLINKDTLFQKLISKPLILECMDWLFERDTPHQKYYLSSFQAHILNPGVSKMKLHIDTPVPEPLPEWIIKANTIWVLDEFNGENGATEYIPGSHKWKHKPRAEDQSRDDLTIANAPVGSVLLTHGALWHRGGANMSNSSRLALLNSFAASYAREIANEENYSVQLSEEMYSQASSQMKAILGLDHGIRPGADHQRKK